MTDRLTETEHPAGAPVPGIYRHCKGETYQVFGVARHSESEDWLVVYQALYGERGFWVRPLSLWLEPPAHGNGKRFTLVYSNELSLAQLAESGEQSR